MKTLACAVLGVLIAAVATGCCCSHGCNTCGYNAGGCNSCYGAAPTYNYAPGGCPNGNCGVGAPGFYPQGAYYGPTDVMTSNAAPLGTPVAMTATPYTPQPSFAQSPYIAQTAMAPLESLPTY